MNIRDSMNQQLIDLSAHLLETAALDVSQLGTEWEARRDALRRDALFLDTFIIPDIDSKPPYLDLRAGTAGGQRRQAEYVGAAGYEELPERPDGPAGSGGFPRGNGRAVEAEA